MLNQKFRPAFGYIIAQNTVEPFSSYTTVIDNTSESVLFYTDGYLDFFKDDVILYTTRAGMMEVSSSHPRGSYVTVAGPNGCSFFCLDPKANKGSIPDTEFKKVVSGLNVEVNAGTKLYLCSGQIKIDEDIIDGPKQLYIRSDKKIIQTLTDCYFILFL